MPEIDVPLERVGFGSTSRSDLWWVAPLVVFLGLGAFVVYATWAGLQGDYYRFGPYLSPFYSPELFGSAHAWFGPKPGWWPMAHLVSGHPDSLGSGWLSRDLLLL